MLKRSLIGLSRPQIEYTAFQRPRVDLQRVDAPQQVTLLLPGMYDMGATGNGFDLKPGVKVKVGQKLTMAPLGSAHVSATVAGTVQSLSPQVGDFGKKYTAVVIKSDGSDAIDDDFLTAIENPDLDMLSNYLACVPGAPDLKALSDTERPIHTIVVLGSDTDLLLQTSRYILDTQTEAISEGIRILKAATGVKKVVLASMRDQIPGRGHIGAELKPIDTAYPSALPKLLMKDALGTVVPAGKVCADMGVCFLKVEAVAAIGKALLKKKPVFDKLLTIVDKAGEVVFVVARIGTPVSDVLTNLGITIDEGDRIINGGPMTGLALHSENQPVTPDMDGLVIQTQDQILRSSDYPCVNCGECVRICPALVPVNMLIRFLEAGQYEDAAQEYDLYSCVDCGLCSTVCPSRIPIFQYIRLAKFQLEQQASAEATDG